MPVTISRILVPTDFSANADRALTYALDLGNAMHASVHLVHVIDDPLATGVWSSDVNTADIAALQIDLVRNADNRLRRSVAENAGTVSTEVRTGQPARQILDAARDHGAELIVMGTGGRAGLAHVFLGSVAERVVRLASCPVLTIASANDTDRAASVA